MEFGSWPSARLDYRGDNIPMKFKGHTVHASMEAPQYMIMSDKTDHIAMHKGSALIKIA